MIGINWSNPAHLAIALETSAFSPAQATRVTIGLDEYMHDMAKVIFVGVPPQNITTVEGTAIHITWGDNPLRLAEFTGIVQKASVEHVSDTVSIDQLTATTSPLRSVTLTCLGSTIRWQSGSRRVYTNVSVPAVLEDLARFYRLSYDIEAHDFAWPRLAQLDMSDWAFAIDCAKKIGYVLTVHGTHLRLFDPTRVIGRTQEPTVLNTNAVLGDGTRHLIKFTPSFGSYTSTGHRGPKVYTGVDATTGSTFTYNTSWNAAATGMGTQTVTSNATLQYVTAAQTPAMAQAIGDGADRNTLWATTADAECIGDPTVRPGVAVIVNGFSAEFDGYWYVISAEHFVSNGAYRMVLKLGKDAHGSSDRVPVPARKPIAPVTSMYLNGAWVAAHRGLSRVE